MVTKPPLPSSDLHLRVRETPYTPTLPHLFWFSSAGPTSGNRVHQLFPPFSKSLTLLIQPQCMDIICCNKESKQRVSLEEDSLLCFNFCLFFCHKVLDVPQHKRQRGGCRLWFNVPPRPPEVLIIVISSYKIDRTNACNAALTWSRSVNCDLQGWKDESLCT